MLSNILTTIAAVAIVGYCYWYSETQIGD